MRPPGANASGMPASAGGVLHPGNHTGARAPMKDLFRKTAHWTSDKVGSPLAFAFAVLAILAWGITGPLFGYSDTWQLIINTATTILTFLMVFLIQNTQNRDARAIHLKLDELIRAIDPARDDLIDVEDVTEDELAYLQRSSRRSARARSRKSRRPSERACVPRAR